MKKISILLIVLSFVSFSLFSQETEADEQIAFDDFDSIFADAEDVEEPVLEETTETEASSNQVQSAFSSMVHFTGKFSGDVGAAYVHMRDEEDGDNDFSGFFSLKNYLNMTVTPGNHFVIRGSLYTGIDNGFTLELSSFYFDYLLLDHFYISAGKKSISWGNIRLFNTDYYGCEKHSICLYSTGPRYANIFVEDETELTLEVRYPWSSGTITLAATGNFQDSVNPNNFNYYGSIEFSILKTNFNIFAKRPEKNSDIVKSELFGLEFKRTIFNYDVYAQGLVRVKDFNQLYNPDGYDYFVATAGIYRLFDSITPNFGFNLEYQHEYNPSSEEVHYDRLAFEGGLKRMGKKNNMKVGVMSHYNITERHGYSGLNFLISGILPYADWSNKIAVGYGSKYVVPAVMVSTSISLALDY